MNEKISVIIPVYNSQKYLSQCIESVLNQTYQNFELILVDDNSTDDSGRICDNYANKDRRIIVIHHEINKGLSQTREDGVRIASGNWLSFLDNDDVICPFMYERLCKELKQGDLICARGEDRSSIEINNEDWPMQEKVMQKFEGAKACDLIFARKVNWGFIGPVWGKLIKKELILNVLTKIEPFKKELPWVYFEDVLFTPMMFYFAENVIYVDELMYYHRKEQTNLSSTLLPKQYHYEAVYAGEYVVDFLKEHRCMDAFYMYLYHFFLLMESNWYKIWRNESNEEKKLTYERKIDYYYQKYSDDLKNIPNYSLSMIFTKGMIRFFRRHKRFWAGTFGIVYFEFFRKIAYK